MNGVLCDEGKLKLLHARVQSPPVYGSYLALSTYAGPVTRTSEYTDFTAAHEPTFLGYARQPVIFDPLDPGAFLPDFHVRIYAAPVLFINTGGVDSPLLYSWFWINSLYEQVMLAGLFDTPFVIPSLTGTYSTTPFWQLTGET